MNELDELVYAMEDLDLSKNELKVFMNKGETGGPQGEFEGSTSSVKEEWQEPETNDKNFANKAKKNQDFIKQFHNKDKAKFMSNRLPTGDIGTQFLDLDCKRDPEERYALKATFDGETFRKIQGLKLNLKTEDNLLSRMQRMFARNKISYHEYQEIEKVIEITQTTGKHKLNLLTKPMIDQILRKIPEKKRKRMNYVHLGGIQILVKSTFKEGINCPIVINLSDERFINAREGNLGIVEGNLAYTKLLFTYYPKYCISLKDADFNDALSLHFQIKRKDLFKPGNHIMSIYYQALYT
ncbi:hypothetical protein H5410_029233, partial [Solanum commersonii]